MSYESTTKSTSVEKPVKNAEKSSSSSGDYAELTGVIVGKAEDSFDGPVTVTIQITGGPSSGDLVLSFPNKEAAVAIPDMLDDKGQHVPPIPVKITVTPGEGAPPPGTAKPKDQAKEKEPAKEPAAGGSHGTY